MITDLHIIDKNDGQTVGNLRKVKNMANNSTYIEHFHATYQLHRRRRNGSDCSNHLLFCNHFVSNQTSPSD